MSEVPLEAAQNILNKVPLTPVTKLPPVVDATKPWYTEELLEPVTKLPPYNDPNTPMVGLQNPYTETNNRNKPVDNPGTIVNNYNLTANYPQESQMSLIERVKVLEALG
jgi:hypothetical protein